MKSLAYVVKWRTRAELLNSVMDASARIRNYKPCHVCYFTICINREMISSNHFIGISISNYFIKYRYSHNFCKCKLNVIKLMKCNYSVISLNF